MTLKVLHKLWSKELSLPSSLGILMKGAHSMRTKTIEMVDNLNKNTITKDDPEFAEILATFFNNNKDHFGHGLGIGLAQYFVDSDESTRSKNWKKIREFIDSYSEISLGFGQQIGNVFKSINPTDKGKIWERLIDLCKTNGSFASGLGESMSNVLEFLTDDDLEKIGIVLFNNPEFAPNFSTYLMTRIQSYETKYFKNKLTFLLNNIPKFAKFFNYNSKELYDSLSKEMQTQIANELKTHNLITIIRINDILCDFCDELIPTLGYTDHMNEKHSEILDEVIQAQGKYEKCRHCGDVIKNDFNDVIRHLGDKHYDSLPVESRIILYGMEIRRLS